MCMCRSATATLNIAVNHSVPLQSPLSSRPSGSDRVPLLSSYQLLLLVIIVSTFCVLSVLCISSCVLIRRRRRRSATSRDPEMTSHGKMAMPLCSNGKLATIHTFEKQRDNNGLVRITSYFILSVKMCAI